jgi:hypothetical protein
LDKHRPRNLPEPGKEAPQRAVSTSGEIGGPGRPGSGPSSGGTVEATLEETTERIVKRPPTTRTTPSVSARNLASEIVQTENAIQRLESIARYARWSLEALNVVNVLGDVLKARAMAAATLVGRSPYYKEIQWADGIANSAKQLADYYAPLDVMANMPRKGSDEFDSWSQLQQIQFSYLTIESNMHDALESVNEARRNIADQLSDLNDALSEKVIHATFLPYISLPLADLYFYAEAGGQIRSSLIDAANYYGNAERAIRPLQSLVQGIIRAEELRLRELGVTGLAFSEMSNEEVRSARFYEFHLPRR